MEFTALCNVMDLTRTEGLTKHTRANKSSTENASLSDNVSQILTMTMNIVNLATDMENTNNTGPQFTFLVMNEQTLDDSCTNVSDNNTLQTLVLESYGHAILDSGCGIMLSWRPNMSPITKFLDGTLKGPYGPSSCVAWLRFRRPLLFLPTRGLYQFLYNGFETSDTRLAISSLPVKPWRRWHYVARYIYTDAICCKSVEEAFSLLKAAKRFGLVGLSSKSLEFLEKFIEDFQPTDDESKNSLFDLLVMAQEKRLNELSEKCWSLLIKFAEEVIPCESFLNLDYDITLKIFSNADFQYTDQLKLFHAIRDWGLAYIKRNNKKVQEMGELVENLIKCIDFTKIEDGDFVQSVLASNCLGKAEIITFFMSHGMEVPREISNNKQCFWASFFKSSEKESEKLKKTQQGQEGSSGSTQLETISENDKELNHIVKNGPIPNGTGPEFNKVRRFKKGYQIPQTEISLEHELRFRCSQNIKLFGVGCGFLFSNTDMGVALHCQGPWETRQWTDMMQETYCRVSSDKQDIANINLMYAAPIELQANQSYKILVKIIRMSGGSSEVDLWGGTEGKYNSENDDAEFWFLKAAVDPTKTPDESEGDTKPSLITEIYYTISDGADLKPIGSVPRRQRMRESEKVVSPPPKVEQERDQALDVFAPKDIRRRQRDPIVQKPPEDTAAVLRSFMESGSVVSDIRKRSSEQKSDSYTPTNRRDTSEKLMEPSSTTSYTRRRESLEKPAEVSINKRMDSIDKILESTSYSIRRRESIDKQQSDLDKQQSSVAENKAKAAENISSILAGRRNEPPAITEKPAFMRRREAAAEAAVPWARTALKTTSDSTPSWLSSRSSSLSRKDSLTSTPSLRSRDTSLSRFGTTGSGSTASSRYGSGFGTSSTSGYGSSGLGSRYGSSSSSPSSSFSSSRFGSSSSYGSSLRRY
ncbi:unnamed protein product, partial [Meganyctiphanes norvegica]